MKLIKLGIISLVLLVMMIWGIALLFPANTVVSRATNVGGTADSLMRRLRSNEISVQQWLTVQDSTLDIKSSDIPFYENNLFSKREDATTKGDTLFLQVSRGQKVLLQGGLALYQLQQDSATAQLFYVFQTPWYKPHIRWKMMMADKAMGPGLDSLLNRLKKY